MRKRTGNIAQRGERSFRIRYYNGDGLRQAETIKGSRDDAERELAIRIGEIAKGLPVSSKPNTVLFGELADDVLTDYEINNFASLDHIETRFRLHLVPVFGKRKASQITTAQIKSYILTRQKAKASTGTINRELQAMRHTFKLAMEGRKLMHMPHVPMLRENNVRAGFFTREEVDRLCRQLKAPLDSFVRFAFLTGWRLEEIRGLLWRNVDFEKGEIRLDVGTTKNREGRVFPMTAELRRLLKTISFTVPAVRPQIKDGLVTAGKLVLTVTPFVFVLDRKPIGEFRKTWKTACHKAGLPCIVDKDNRLIKSLRIFHDLRRSAAKNLIAQGIPERVVMQMCGWRTRSVFDRYCVVGEADLRAAAEKMDGGKRANVGAKRGSDKRKT